MLRTFRIFLCLLLCAALSFCPIPAGASNEPETGKSAVLTFDDGPNGAVTEALLELLAEEQVHATFFLCAYQIRKQPELVLRIAAAGHTIGIHGASHQKLAGLPAEMIYRELTDCIDAVTEITGQQVRYFRPPYGLYDNNVAEQARQAGVQIVLWNVDPKDWRDKNAEKIVAGVLSQADDESIILLHDLDMQTVYATRTIIRSLRQRGYEFTTLDGA